MGVYLVDEKFGFVDTTDWADVLVSVSLELFASDKLDCSVLLTKV